MDASKNRLLLLTRSRFWAITPDTLAAFMDVSLVGTWEAAKPTMTGTKSHKIAVIPIEGVLTKDGPGWMGSNYDTISAAVENASADPDVKRIVLAVDSPGGEVTGLPEAAAVIAQAAKVKPVSAMVDGLSASAAYWLTSQASDITVTPSGEVGSVGVRIMHMDISKMMEDRGVKVTEIFAGNHKTEWSPFKPMSPETVAYEQARLDVIHRDFIKAVSTGRSGRASIDIEADRFGEGRMFSASDALPHGLIDAVMSPRSFHRSIMPPQEAEAAPPPEFGLPRRARLELEKRRF
jgi:signal peptide peptidase SppA